MRDGHRGTGGTGRAGGRGTGQSRPGGLSAGLGSATRGRRRSPVLVTGGCSSPLPGGARGSAGAAAAGPGRAGSCGPCPLSPGGFRPLAPHRGPPRCLPGLREEARAAARLPTCRVLDGAVCAEPQSPAERFFPPVFQVTDGLMQGDVSSEAVPVPAPAPQPARRSDPDWGLAVTLNKSSSRLAL